MASEGLIISVTFEKESEGNEGAAMQIFPKKALCEKGPARARSSACLMCQETVRGSQVNDRTVGKNTFREVIQFQIIQGLIGHTEDFSSDWVRWEATGGL